MVLSRAQKVTLAVGVPLTCAAMGFGGLNAVAAVGRGSEQFSMGVPITAGKLTMHLSGGDIRMGSNGWPTGSALLTATVHYSLIRPHVSITGESVSVNCADPIGWCDTNSVLSVPGDVSAAALSTDQGNVTVVGPLAADTLSLASSMGDISASGITASDVSAHSDMGDITLTFTKAPRTLMVSDSMGDINIVLPIGVTYHVIATSGMGSVNDAVRHSDSASDSISASTSMGDVSITYGS